MGADLKTLFQSYLFAYVFWVTLSLGCMGLLLMHHIFRAQWGRAILRMLEAGSRTLPLMLVAALPIALMALPELYPWARPAEVAGDAVLKHRSVYMNPMGFMLRAAIYYAVWIGLSVVLNRSSLRQDRTGDQNEAQLRSNVSAPGLVAFVLSVTFAFNDWVMSVEPHWTSTIFGVGGLINGILGALALLTFLLMRQAGGGPLAAVVNKTVVRDLGNMMLAFTMFWAYITLSQFLIIWSGNLPGETAYYAARNASGWGPVGTILILGQFALPFLALVANRTKRTPGLLMCVAGWAFLFRIVDIYWIVMPSLRRTGFSPHWLDFAALIILGAVWFAVFAWSFASNPRIARHAPATEEVAGHA